MENRQLFAGEEYQKLFEAIKKAALDDHKDHYEWLEKTPITSIVVFIVDKLHEMGYIIVKRK